MDIVAAARKEALAEIAEYGTPHPVHLELSFEVGQRLAEELKADKKIVDVGTLLMDIKLGEAFKAGKLKEHVAMSVVRTKELLKEWDVDDERIINCVEAHHGTISFSCIEAEICANADCYRFLHPTGIMTFLTMLGKRCDDFKIILEQLEKKMDEKWSILSLDTCKAELEPFYNDFKKWIMVASTQSRSR
ncbi:hypothetical protein GOV07_03045 [Candidatus Woesearchaeota archaeon]|nr:hypothetical protein [Candidatus Woesearchaeota archaeon]